MGSDRKTAAKSLHRGGHYRLIFSILTGAGAALLVQGTDVATRGLIGWDICVLVLLAGIWRMMATTTLAELRRKAAQQDETAPVILGLMVTAVVASLGGILAEMSHARSGDGRTDLFIALVLGTLVLSWVCMHVLFAIHYAHRYYGDHATADKTRSGLIFPEPNAAPSYMEFVYFAFCVGMTYQVADIMTGTRAFRKLITLHGVLSFFYNTFVLALAVSLFSGISASH
ncbi:MAG TPA: DUF1345 domain-containing protein [Micropepsaceae bacterium]|nr:DUF1345 domain-containing protein [Micropepsaceae bacterium]